MCHAPVAPVLSTKNGLVFGSENDLEVKLLGYIFDERPGYTLEIAIVVAGTKRGD